MFACFTISIVVPDHVMPLPYPIIPKYYLQCASVTATIIPTTLHRRISQTSLFWFHIHCFHTSGTIAINYSQSSFKITLFLKLLTYPSIYLAISLQHHWLRLIWHHHHHIPHNSDHSDTTIIINSFQSNANMIILPTLPLYP